MNKRPDNDRELPVLTEVVKKASANPNVQVTLNIAELETRICAESLQLSEHLINEAFQEIESVVFDRVVSRLRSELPELVDRVLQDHIKSKA